MSPVNLTRAATARLIGLLLLAVVTIPQVAYADTPELVIRLTGGETEVYQVEAVQRVGFEGDTLVVATASGVDLYPVEFISRIEFLWDTAAIEDPTQAAGLIAAIHLFQNQPNPFSPETRIGFELPTSGDVEMRIYGPDGRLVRTLIRGELQSGRHELRWDGLDDSGRKVSSGVYFYSLRAPGIEESRRMILLR